MPPFATSPVRVAYVIPNIESGGTEHHLLALVRRLDRERFDPFLVTTAGGGRLYEAFRSVLPVTVLGDPARANPFRTNPVRHLRTVAVLARIFRSRRPHVVHAYLPAANVLGPLAARIAGGSRVVSSKRSLSDYKNDFPPLVGASVHLGNRLSDAILVNSDAVRRDVERTERHWEGKIRRIYNGVAAVPAREGREAAAFREREGIPAGARVVLCVSNFFAYKGHADLIEAAARVSAEAPDAVFILAGGDAGSLEACRRMAREAGVGGTVVFAGPRADIPDLLSAADLFVHPSRQEGFSNAVLEAMAAGLPVVACDVGGNPEAVAHGETGLLVPPRRPSELAAAVLRLLADPGEAGRMGRAGRERWAREFSVDRMVRETEALYGSLLGPPRKD